MPLTKKPAIDKSLRKGFKKTEKTLVVPASIKLKSHPVFKEYRLLARKDAPKSFPKIDKERCVGPVYFVVEAKSRIVVWLATKMPDGLYPAWSTCETCMHRFNYCTCTDRGILEPRVMRWMHDRIIKWQGGATADETRNMPAPDYTPWIDKNRDREVLDMSRFIKPKKKVEKKSLHKPVTKPVTKPGRSLPAPKTAERQAAVAAATKDINSLDFGSINRKASDRAKQAIEEAAKQLTKATGKKPLRKRT